MNHIKLIKSVQDHELAMARLMSLMDLDPEPKTAEADEIDVLALLIEKYENEAFPIDKPDPIEAIKFRMEQQGLKNRDLVQFIGSAPKVSEVLNGTRNLSLNMIRKLSQGLGISAETLIQVPSQKHADFIGSVKSGFSLQPVLLRSSAHLRSNDKETDAYALWAWQIRVLKKAAEQTLPNNYKRNTVSLEWMQKVAKLSWLATGPSLAVEFLSKSGIHVIIEPHLSKTYLDGAVCLSSGGNPVIALTLRHNRIDSFWFSLMHELAHIALHLDGNEAWYLDDLDVPGGDEIEKEADAMAQEALIPSDMWDKHIPVTADDVRELSKKLEVSLCIVAGRARHESKDHKKFGSFFREKVTPFFAS